MHIYKSQLLTKRNVQSSMCHVLHLNLLGGLTCIPCCKFCVYTHAVNQKFYNMTNVREKKISA